MGQPGAAASAREQTRRMECSREIRRQAIEMEAIERCSQDERHGTTQVNLAYRSAHMAEERLERAGGSGRASGFRFEWGLTS